MEDVMIGSTLRKQWIEGLGGTSDGRG